MTQILAGQIENSSNVLVVHNKENKGFPKTLK